MRTIAAIVIACLFAQGCSSTAPKQAIPAGVDLVTTVRTLQVVNDCSPAWPTPFVIANAEGQVIFARGPIDYRHPVTGRISQLADGSEIAFTDGPVEVEIDIEADGSNTS